MMRATGNSEHVRETSSSDWLKGIMEEHNLALLVTGVIMRHTASSIRPKAPAAFLVLAQPFRMANYDLRANAFVPATPMNVRCHSVCT